MARPAARHRRKAGRCVSRKRRRTNPNTMCTSKTTTTMDATALEGAPDAIRRCWDASLTLAQNYARMGLVSAVNGRAGGVVRAHQSAALLPDDPSSEHQDKVTIEYRSFEEFENMPSVGRCNLNGRKSVVDDDDDDDDDTMEDSDDGGDHAFGQNESLAVAKQIGVIPGSKASITAALGFVGSPVPTTIVTSTRKKILPLSINVVEAMETMVKNAPPAAARTASDHERLFLVELIEKHGDDFEAMSRDRKLNKFQMSAGQLRRKIKNCSAFK